MSGNSSVEAQVQRIREAVLARHGYAPGAAIDLCARGSAVDEAQQMAVVNAHWGIASDLPVVGPLLVLFRRVLRIMLRWYINPIVEQQNRFNQAAVRALFELRAENENLRAELSRARQLNERDSE